MPPDRCRVSFQGWIFRLVDWLSKAQISLKDLGHFTHQSGLYMPKPFCMANLYRGELARTNNGRRWQPRLGIEISERHVPRPCAIFGARNHGDPKQTLAVANCAL